MALLLLFLSMDTPVAGLLVLFTPVPFDTLRFIPFININGTLVKILTLLNDNQ